ncbi:MAG: dihydrofolate reductase family protein [Clostridiales bacterium]|nr:dihydrofolate reductase family protein [Clostridiales bacterium]
MGKITVAMYLTLDGVFEAPAWTMPYWDDQLSDYQDKAQQEADALLLGRTTYEEFAAAWPGSRDEGAKYMNEIKKCVPTATLHEPAWQAQLPNGNIEQEIRSLRERHSLLVYGSGQLVRALMGWGLVDEYRQMVFPVITGQGRRLFDGEVQPCAFRKADSAVTPKGVVLTTYRR